jgi:transcriptional regulator with XRE-family HTH domain
MADLKDVVAVNLRRLRHAKGWTQEDLADRVGLSVRYVGQIERAQTSMSVSVLGRLAHAMNVDAAVLTIGLVGHATAQDTSPGPAGNAFSTPAPGHPHPVPGVTPDQAGAPTGSYKSKMRRPAKHHVKHKPAPKPAT